MIRAGRCARAALDDRLSELAASQRSTATCSVPDSSRLAQRMSLTMRASRSDSPAIDVEQAVTLRLERGLLPPKRQRGAVDRGERRPQLVGDRRHELALQALDAPFVREVAERVDGAARERHARDREPALRAACSSDRDGLGPRGPPVPSRRVCALDQSRPSPGSHAPPAGRRSAPPASRVITDAAVSNSRATCSSSTRKTPPTTRSASASADWARASSSWKRSVVDREAGAARDAGSEPSRSSLSNRRPPVQEKVTVPRVRSRAVSGDRDVRADPELAQQPEVLVVDRRLGEILVTDVEDDLGLTRAKHGRRPDGVRRRLGPAAVLFGMEGGCPLVGVGFDDSLERALVVDEWTTHESAKSGTASSTRLSRANISVVERRAEEAPDLGKHSIRN